MKTYIFSIALVISLLMNSSLLGQKIITANDFALAGDSIGISTSNDFSIDYNTTGEGITWDFSTIGENNQLFEIAYDVSTGGFIIELQFGQFAPSRFQADYFQPYDGLPLDQIGGFLPINIESINKLVKVESDHVNIVGYAFKINGQQVGFRSDTIETYYELPLHYGDSSSSRGYTVFDFNPVYDAQLIQYRQHSSVVDGYGQLITPYGSYDNVLRIHHTIEEKDSLQISIGAISQWVPINRTINEYEWWDNDKKRPVLKIETQGVANNEVPNRISFLNNQIAGLATHQMDSRVFPNPSDGILTIQSSENLKELKIWSADGQCVFEATSSGKVTTVDVKHLSSGVYTLQLISQKSHHFKSIIIK